MPRGGTRSTGNGYFRPPLGEGKNAEAARITVGGNVFVGGNTPVAYVTSVDCVVEANLIYRPGKWVIRILQEKPTDRFVACRDGVFGRNVIVWRRGDLSRFVNVGPNTQTKTFRFQRNLWYCADAPAASRPDLPTEEAGGVHGLDPEVQGARTPSWNLQIGNADIAARFGPDQWRNRRRGEDRQRR